MGGFVHSAGLGPFAPARSFDASLFAETMSVNVASSASILKVLASKKSNGLSLASAVLISSIASFSPYRGGGIYSDSKAALCAYMKSAALEFAPRIRINLVAPGGINTPMTSVFFEDSSAADNYAASVPLGLGRVSDVAAAAKFLLSEDARWITGQTIVVDGGFSISGSRF